MADAVPAHLKEQALVDARAVLAGHTFTREHSVGQRHYVTYGAPIKGNDGGVAAALAVSWDITERKLATERVQLALDAGAIIGTWVWDVPGDHFIADELFARSFGLDPGECREGLRLDQVSASIHADDLVGVQGAMAQALARGGEYRHQYRVRRADGKFYWVEACGRVELDGSGKPARFPGVLLDCEQRRRMERERDQAVVLLRSFVEAVPGVVYAKDLQGRMLLANRGTAAVVGKSMEAILGRARTSHRGS